MNSQFKIYLVLLSCSFMACKTDKKTPVQQTNTVEVKETIPTNNQFNAYWYAGNAEINSYTLKQARYGEIRDGEVVLVFVTEPFSLNKQVKLDNPTNAGDDKVSVLKLNNIRKFNTGIYDYSVMTSTFTPIDSNKYPHTLKLNTSMQEWCGHTFTQLNLKENNYQFKQFSYFEDEGDEERNIPITMFEDELMTRIRLNNGQLPIGEIDLIFSVVYSRFSHTKLQASKVKISKTVAETTATFKIEYLTFSRTVTFEVEKEFPYKIMSWSEHDGDGLITEARLKKSIMEPYWNLKSVDDEAKRKELQLIK